jgi:hypothetical protein
MRRLLLATAVAALALFTLASPAGAVVLNGHGAETFVVSLAPSGDPNGSGFAVVNVNASTEKVCYVVFVRNIDQPQEPAPGLGSAHIHVLPSGAIAVDLEASFRALGGDAYVASGCVHADATVIENIVEHPELYYVNVHTAAYPGGAVQGALG